MGAVTYIVVPKLKLMFCLGKNINVNDVEDWTYESELIKTMDYDLERRIDEAMHKDYKNLTLEDIGTLVEATKIAQKTLDQHILQIKLSTFFYLIMKKVDPETEVLDDYSERFTAYEQQNFTEIDITQLIRGENE